MLTGLLADYMSGWPEQCPILIFPPDLAPPAEESAMAAGRLARGT